LNLILEDTYNKNRIPKTGDFSWRTIQNLGNSINKKSKRNHEETVWQENTKFSEIEARRQHIVRSKEYPVKTIFKEAGPKEI